MPKSEEGKVLATADALAHLTTDFYVFTTWSLSDELTLAEVKAWTLKKLERDFHVKIFYDDVRAEVKSDYELLKNLFSR